MKNKTPKEIIELFNENKLPLYTKKQKQIYLTYFGFTVSNGTGNILIIPYLGIACYIGLYLKTIF